MKLNDSIWIVSTNLNEKHFYHIMFATYLRNKGLSSSVKKVTAFPACPALPVRPEKHKFCSTEILLSIPPFIRLPSTVPACRCVSAASTWAHSPQTPLLGNSCAWSGQVFTVHRRLTKSKAVLLKVEPRYKVSPVMRKLVLLQRAWFQDFCSCTRASTLKI